MLVQRSVSNLLISLYLLCLKYTNVFVQSFLQSTVLVQYLKYTYAFGPVYTTYDALIRHAFGSISGLGVHPTTHHPAHRQTVETWYYIHVAESCPLFLQHTPQLLLVQLRCMPANWWSCMPLHPPTWQHLKCVLLQLMATAKHSSFPKPSATAATSCSSHTLGMRVVRDPYSKCCPPCFLSFSVKVNFWYNLTRAKVPSMVANLPDTAQPVKSVVTYSLIALCNASPSR